MVDATLSLATEIDYRIQRGSSLMGRARTYLTNVLRRRFPERWDNGIIVLPCLANQQENLDCDYLLTRNTRIALLTVSTHSVPLRSGLVNGTKKEML